MSKLAEPLSLLAANALLLPLALVFALFPGVVLEGVNALVVGWWRFLQRVGGRIDFEPLGILTGAVCIVAVVLTLHYFAAWLYGAIRVKNERNDWPTPWRWSWTLSVVAAVVLLFAAGLVGVGLFRTTTWFFETPVYFQRNNDFTMR